MANPAESKEARTAGEIARLKTYTEGLKQRLRGQLDKELRNVLEIDLRKTEAKIAKLI